MSSDRIEYLRTEATDGQLTFPESVTLAYKWVAPDYDAKKTRPLTKPKGGFFVGCSLEGLMALGTIRAHMAARAPKEAVINGAKYDLTMYRSPNNRNVRTFYPVFLSPSETDDQQQRRQPPEGTNLVRIVAALVNPAGNDEGKEKITLINTGSRRTRVDGFKLVDKAGNAYGIALQELEPGVPEVVRLPKGSIQLSNKGGRLQLVDGSGRLVHAVSYTKKQASRENETIVF